MWFQGHKKKKKKKSSSSATKIDNKLEISGLTFRSCSVLHSVVIPSSTHVHARLGSFSSHAVL